MKATRRLAATAAVTALLLAACGTSDDGATVTEIGGEAGSGSASGSASGSGSASAPSGSGSGSSSASATAGDGGATASDGGFAYASDVSAHRLVVEDVCLVKDLLDADPVDVDAIATIYRDGVSSVNSDGSVRSIGGFAASDDRLHGHDDHFGTATPLDDFVTSALDGTGAFEGEDVAVRGQGIEKGIQDQVMVAWVVHELNTAVAKAREGDLDVASGAPHNWDEAWAFYHGAAPGCAPWATANSRAANFGTTGDGEVAVTNSNILLAMQDGLAALVEDQDADAAAAAADEVVRNLVVTYSQAAIRYATLVEADLEAGDAAAAREHQAEGWTYFRVIEPFVADEGADVDTILSILDLANEPGANGGGDDVRAALRPAWDALGIDEDREIGVLR